MLRRIATVRGLPGSQGQIAVVHLTERLLSDWRMRTHQRGLAACRGGVRARRASAAPTVLQASRARAADEVCEKVKRPDRLGAEPRALRIVGLGHRARPYLLVGFDVRDARLRASRRVPVLRRGQRASSIARTATSTASPTGSPSSKASVVDHDFRIRSASGDLGLAARPRRADARFRRRRPASRRHRRRHHRAARRSQRIHGAPPTRACATPSRRSRKPSCCGTPTTGSCSAIRNSRPCTICSPERVVPGKAYAEVMEGSHACRSSSIGSSAATAAASRRAHLRGRSSATGAGCRSTSAAPRTAATSRSAPTSRP